MRPEIDHVLDVHRGVASRTELLRSVSRNVLDHEIDRRHLVAIFPRAYCRPWDVDQQDVRERAALASVGAPAALSHLTTLQRTGLLPASDSDRRIHVVTTVGRHPIGRAGELVVHRTRRRTAVTTRDGVRSVGVARALVDSWPLLPFGDRRGLVIDAVRAGLTTPAELNDEALAARGARGMRALRELTGQLDGGCDSKLELWGYAHVFAVPGLDHGRRQLPVATPAGRFRLDLGYEDERVGVEMDGRRFHSSDEARERDMRRDAALAALGWVIVRFSYQRLHEDVPGCRRDLAAVLAARRWRVAG